ncbi:DUF2793 domain-containing protein [Fulvimarina sp. MAC3]|uniref:DUF2793 domain-containing protein n=1 Tax=Fulvimarina sp. MAC3 TaxID=3148887 RepID=UPI0031FD74CF
MTDGTPSIGLPYIMASQAQKHVTHNMALTKLDALVQLSARSRRNTLPPDNPSEGERHLAAEGASGAWAGLDGQVLLFSAGAWMALLPRAGWIAYVEDEDIAVLHDGAAWRPLAETRIDRLGVNTDADGNNRLAVKANSIAFSHDDVSGSGSGDIRGAFNKSDAAKDAGFSFQTGWSARALVGLYGDDDFRIKVSPDGTSFLDAVVVDRTSGHVGIGRTPTHPLDVNGTIDAGALIARGQIGGVSWFGDIDGAKWSTKLGGYYLSFMGDGDDTANLEGGDIPFEGRTFRVKARLHPSGTLDLAGTARLTAMPTTASGTNVFADGEGQLLRSTSSARYKREIEPLDMAYAEALLAVRPVWYRSTAPADDPAFSWYGFLAEDVAAVDPRLATFTYPDEAYEVVEIEDETGSRTERRLRPGAVPEPRGVDYARFTVIHHALIAEMRETIAELEARITALERLE